MFLAEYRFLDNMQPDQLQSDQNNSSPHAVLYKRSA